MTQMTLGQRIAALRRQKELTQEALAEILGVSAQAVSKWENDVSCPDIMLLPQLARTLDVTVDTLLSGEQEPETRLIPAGRRKSFNDLILKMRVDSSDGDRVRINLPMPLIKIGLESGNTVQINGMNNVDMEQILQLVESGVLGKLVEIDSDNDHVEIWVE